MSSMILTLSVDHPHVNSAIAQTVHSPVEDGSWNSIQVGADRCPTWSWKGEINSAMGSKLAEIIPVPSIVALH